MSFLILEDLRILFVAVCIHIRNARNVETVTTKNKPNFLSLIFPKYCQQAQHFKKDENLLRKKLPIKHKIVNNL